MFCHKCGRELPAGSQFCPKCGSKVSEPTQDILSKGLGHTDTQSMRKSTDRPKTMKYEDGVCPNCGSRDCEIQVQQNITGSGKNYNAGMGCLGFLLTGPFGLLCGLCGTGSKTSTTHKSMWVCKKCGNRFPTRKDWVTNLSAVAGIICSILTSGIIFSAFVAISALYYESTGGLVVAVVLAAITFGIFVFVKNVIKNDYGEGPLNEVLSGLLSEGEYRRMKSSCYMGIIITAITLVLVIWLIASA